MNESTYEEIIEMLEGVEGDLKMINEEGKGYSLEEQMNDFLQMEDELETIIVKLDQYMGIRFWREIRRDVSDIESSISTILDTEQYIERGNLDSIIDKLGRILADIRDRIIKPYEPHLEKKLEKIRDQLEKHDEKLLNELPPDDTRYFRRSLEPAMEDLNDLIKSMKKRGDKR